MKSGKNLLLALTLMGLAFTAAPLTARPQRVLHVPGEYAALNILFW